MMMRRINWPAFVWLSPFFVPMRSAVEGEASNQPAPPKISEIIDFRGGAAAQDKIRDPKEY